MTTHRSILVTGGAGYIGSHICVELLSAGYEVTSIDNYSNSNPLALERVQKITGKPVNQVCADIRDSDRCTEILRQSNANAVIHCAGLKSVGESNEKPLEYYDNNVNGSMRLLKAMAQCNVKTIVFSSSATVYGAPEHLPLTEDHPLKPTNPYGRTKLVIENLLRDMFASDPEWKICLLRYFNPAGAHASGLIGEDPRDTPNNLVPYLSQVAIGRREYLNVWGNDYETPDGTGVRDYIHVTDLAAGHLRALEFLENSRTRKNFGQCTAINLGVGVGYSVLEFVKAFERAARKTIPYQIHPRRSGDVASSFADPTLAKKLLGWKPEKELADICEDTWHWQTNNPSGYFSQP